MNEGQIRGVADSAMRREVGCDSPGDSVRRDNSALLLHDRSV